MIDGDAAYIMWHAALALTLSFYYTDVVDLCCEGCSGRSMCVGPCTHACVHVRYTCMCVHAVYAPHGDSSRFGTTSVSPRDTHIDMC